MSVSPKRGGATVAVSVRGPSTHIVQVKGKQTFLPNLWFTISSVIELLFSPSSFLWYRKHMQHMLWSSFTDILPPSLVIQQNFNIFILIYHMVMNKKKRYIILVVNY